MSSSKTKVRAVRLRNETYDYFADKPLNRIVESVHELAKAEEIEIKDGGVKVVHSDNT